MDLGVGWWQHVQVVTSSTVFMHKTYENPWKPTLNPTKNWANNWVLLQFYVTKLQFWSPYKWLPHPQLMANGPHFYIIHILYACNLYNPWKTTLKPIKSMKNLIKTHKIWKKNGLIEIVSYWNPILVQGTWIGMQEDSMWVKSLSDPQSNAWIWRWVFMHTICV